MYCADTRGTDAAHPNARLCRSPWHGAHTREGVTGAECDPRNLTPHRTTSICPAVTNIDCSIPRRSLLDRLCRQADAPEHQCRFTWSTDALAFWDNRAVRHYASSDYRPQRRFMERASV